MKYIKKTDIIHDRNYRYYLEEAEEWCIDSTSFHTITKQKFFYLGRSRRVRVDHLIYLLYQVVVSDHM